LVAEQVRVAAKVGANPELKVGSLVAGMIAGADGVDGMDVLRHGAIPATFGGIRAPSTLGSFLRAFDHGNVRQLAARGTAAARRRHARVRRCRLGAAPRLWGHQAGRGVRARQDRFEVVAGARAERAGRHREHAAGGAGRGGGTVAGRQRRLRPGRGQPGGRSHHHRPRGRLHRHDRGARRLRLLRRVVRRRLPPQPSPLLGHRAHGPQGSPHHHHHHHHRRRRLDADQVPQRHLRRTGRLLGLRRRDRRSGLHRVRVQPRPAAPTAPTPH
jgi:hypothetical protein